MVLVLELVDPPSLYQVWSGWFWYRNWWILLLCIRSGLDGSGTGTDGFSYSVLGWSGYFWYLSCWILLFCIRSSLDGSGTGTVRFSYSLLGLVWMVLVLELVDPLILYQAWSGWFWYLNWCFILLCRY
jgi:hypothetical protein